MSASATSSPAPPAAESSLKGTEKDFENAIADVDDEHAEDKEDAVHFCLLAEFDIDAGATLAHQYPYPTGTDEHRLAELMLPDGAHLRGEDWTVFYLGQTASMAVAPVLSHEPTAVAGRPVSSYPPGERPRRGTPGGGLLYVLNCVRMKEDKSMRRGAMVKAMAIATPNPYIGIYKPLLLLALEEYFANPSHEILAKLYDSANAISTAGMPILTREEKILLRQTDRKDCLEFRFGLHEGANTTTDDSSISELAADSSIGHESRDRAPSISSSRPQMVRKNSSSSSSAYHGTPDLNAPPPRRGVPRDTHFFETEAKFRKITVPIRIPMTVFDEDVGDYSIIELVQTFSQNIQPFSPPFHPYLHTNGANTHPVILIFNAILAHKRVMFLGHGLPANHVARMVLASCAMVSGCGQVLRGMTECAFPYANLASLDVLEEFPGFVAGVCNPRFEELPHTWDVLCNLETGKVIVSKELKLVIPSKSDGASESSVPSANSEEASLANGKISQVKRDDCIDNQFIEEILSASNQHYGEHHIRVRFTDYISRFVRLAAYQEFLHLGYTRIGYPYATYRDGHLGSGVVFIDDSLRQREMYGNAHRIDAWRKTRSYRLVQKDWEYEQRHAAIKGFDALHNVKRLRMTRTMTTREADLIFATMIRQVRSYDQVVELLTFLPMHFGGLIPIANGLFHPQASVRNNTLELMCTIQAYAVGRHALQTLNYLHRKTFVEMLERRETHRALKRRMNDTVTELRAGLKDDASETPTAVKGGELAQQQQALKV